MYWKTSAFGGCTAAYGWLERRSRLVVWYNTMRQGTTYIPLEVKYSMVTASSWHWIIHLMLQVKICLAMVLADRY